MHPRHRLRGGNVHRLNVTMRQWAAQNGRVEHIPAFNIVDEPAAAGKQPQIFETLNGAADESVSDGVIADGVSAKCHKRIFCRLDSGIRKFLAA